jgi:hypothetical protein
MESGCLAASSDNFENVLRDLTVSDKGKFKWSGTFENLEIMMNIIYLRNRQYGIHPAVIARSWSLTTYV